MVKKDANPTPYPPVFRFDYQSQSSFGSILKALIKNIKRKAWVFTMIIQHWEKKTWFDLVPNMIYAFFAQECINTHKYNISTFNQHKVWIFFGYGKTFNFINVKVLLDGSGYQNGWFFGKLARGVGHCRSKNLYCKFWTFKQGLKQDFFGKTAI